MQRSSLIILALAIVPVMTWVDGPSAAWVAILSRQSGGGAAALCITLAFLGVAVAVMAALMLRGCAAGGGSINSTRHGGSAGALAVVAAAAALGTAGLLKHLIGRIRPSANGADPWRFEPLAFDDRFTALPSAQAACFAALSLSLAMSLPALRVPLVLGGAAACTSRVLAGAHWPSDVMAGWMLGAAMAAVTHLGHTKRQRRIASRPP